MKNPELMRLLGPLMEDGGRVLVLLARSMYDDLEANEWLILRERLLKHGANTLEAAREISRWQDPTMH